MSTSSLPRAVVEMLAAKSMRDQHAAWHHVRDRWHVLEEPERNSFRAKDWQPPRLNPRRRSAEEPAPPPRDAGSGLDFLFMHRRMIEAVNALLREVEDPTYPKVEGWAQIPWNHDDPEWPMPPYFGRGPREAKMPAVTATWRDDVQRKYENDFWLRTVSLDSFGAEIENGIHNWMHMHWAAAPWFQELPGQDEDDPRNDYLGSTYSSHVNKVFWKLHGWIDDRIGQWERANNTAADFSNSWEGPSHHVHFEKFVVNRQRSVLNASQRADARMFFEKGL